MHLKNSSHFVKFIETGPAYNKMATGMIHIAIDSINESSVHFMSVLILRLDGHSSLCSSHDTSLIDSEIIIMSAIFISVINVL